MRHQPQPLDRTANREDRRKTVNELEMFPPKDRSFHGPFDQGMIDLSELFGFARRNFFRIGILTAVLTALLLMLFSLYPFPYRSTALVLVDPREHRITLTENVLPGIGTDAAILESVVQIVQSDGFLAPVLEELDLAADPVFAAMVSSKTGDQRKLLESFKKNLSVDRVGATFIVEISFKSNDPEKSAHYANSIAEAFVESQKQTYVSANEFAATSLLERLQTLQNNLEASENAVALFKAQRGIVDVTQDSTLLQRELIALNEQIAAANATSEAARAQYEQFRSGAGAGSAVEQVDATQLSELRRQRGQVLQNLSEFGLIYGSRHPRVAAEQSKLSGIERQIVEERQRLLALRKERLDSAVAAQKALEDDLKQLKGEASKTEQAMVQLGSLEREAGANRRLYEEFLNRFKATEEQRSIEVEQVQIASPATPPLRTTRPSRALAGVVFLLFSGVLATAYAVLRELHFTGAKKAPDKQPSKVVGRSNPLRHTSGKSWLKPRFSSKRGQDTENQPTRHVLKKGPSLSHLETAPIYLNDVRRRRDGAFDPKAVAWSLEERPVRRNMQAHDEPGTVVALCSPRICPEKFSISLGFATAAGLHSTPALLLSADTSMSQHDAARQFHSAALDELPISLIDPDHVAKTVFGNHKSFWDVVVGLALSQNGRRSSIIIDAPPITNETDLKQLAQIADYLVIVDYGHKVRNKGSVRLFNSATALFEDRFQLMLI